MNFGKVLARKMSSEVINLIHLEITFFQELSISGFHYSRTNKQGKI